MPSPIAAVAKSFAILSSHLDGESYTMRKCVLAVMREIVAKVLSRDDLDPLIWIRPIRPKMSSPGPMAPSKRRCTGNIAGLYFPVPGQDIDSVLPRVLSLVDDLACVNEHNVQHPAAVQERGAVRGVKQPSPMIMI